MMVGKSQVGKLWVLYNTSFCIVELDVWPRNWTVFGILLYNRAVVGIPRSHFYSIHVHVAVDANVILLRFTTFIADFYPGNCWRGNSQPDPVCNFDVCAKQIFPISQFFQNWNVVDIFFQLFKGSVAGYDDDSFRTIVVNAIIRSSGSGSSISINDDNSGKDGTENRAVLIAASISNNIIAAATTIRFFCVPSSFSSKIMPKNRVKSIYEIRWNDTKSSWLESFSSRNS